ncbi:carbohydrate binding domain-containing protein [Simiduia sp. 21SJ11W-1]|uniref:fibronectin type III domain-containing protein n=1 Tax=Simiduia sp. 21SJ11W-1 TaxID=2909669 RepID=UPI0020A13B36|nr:carbohydrate binding domain-containing protein [Simiduia sp. 21SJ11W-1]UTA46790.1 carbohydrate binding domain-containing protein [Simiduia sp. 21SJ11W-1]
MKKSILACSIALLCAQTAVAANTWQSLNPGAGGQIQDVVADPNQVDVVYLASDMEGVYKSTDNGENWQPTGQLSHNRVYAVAVKPGNSDHLFVGTLFGLHTSTDGGATYDLIDNTKNISFGSVAFKPDNANVIIAGPGWRDDQDFIDNFGETANGEGRVFVSTDGGANWSAVTFDSATNTDRNIYNITFDPANPSTVYLGSNKGLYKSTDAGQTWAKVESPTNRPRSKGVTLSPDGKVLYSVFAANDNNNRDWVLYATPADNINWQAVAAGLNSGKRFWYPEIDPRSTATEHKVLLGTVGDREGLYEGTFNWSGASLSSYSWSKIFGDYSNGNYDIGWDYASPPNARFAHYTPTTGGWDRGVWSTSNQAMFYADHNSGDNSYSWANKYSNPNNSITVNWWGVDWPTYSGKGTESTYTYDVAIHGDYVIQGQADNGLVESWDGGFSWSNMQHRLPGLNLSDVQAVDIADAWGTPTVVAQATSGYGGGAHNGRLYAKKLTTASPTDVWVELAGGPAGKAGVPKGVLRDVAVSPANPAKVFMFSSNYGLYMLEDIGRALDYHQQGEVLDAKLIYQSGGNDTARSARTIAPHPTDENVVFFSSTGGVQGVWRGEALEDGSWSFEQVLNTSGWDAEVHAWEHNGTVYLMNFAKGGGPDFNDGNNWHALLSTDEGQTWTKVFNPDIAKTVRPTSNVAWWDEVSDRFNFSAKGGSAAYADKLVVGYYDHALQLGYGVFMGTIQGDGSVTWEDITADLHFKGLTGTRFVAEDGVMNLYSATPGAGLWKRTVAGVQLPETPAMAPAGADTLSASLNADDNTITLTWADNANNEQGYRIERSNGGAFKVVGQVGMNDTDYLDFDLASNTEYTYRVVAFNAAGVATASNEVTITSGEADGGSDACVAVNLLSNGDFETGDISGGWNLYANTGKGAAATANVGAAAGFSSSNVAHIAISAPTHENDVQFKNTVNGLDQGKTYALKFTGASEAVKTIKVKMHLPVSPWTNVKGEDVITLTPTPQDFTLLYTPAEQFGNLNLGFFLGTDASDVWLDDVSLMQKCDQGITLAEPKNVTATPTSHNSIQVSWDAVADAETYAVQYRESGGSWVDGPTMVASTSTTLTGLNAEASYEVQVRAQNGEVQSAYSTPASATTPATGDNDGDGGDNGGGTGGDNGGGTGGDNGGGNSGSGQACDVPNMLTNGDFETGDTSGWDLYANSNNGASADANIVTDAAFGSANALHVQINATTTENDIQLKNTFGTLTQGETYILTFKAKAAGTKSFPVKIHQIMSPWANVNEGDTINLTDTVQEFSVLYTPESDLGALNLGFFLGGDATDIYIDDVSLKSYCENAVVLASPKNVQTSATSHTALAVSWDAVDGAESYDVQYREAGGSWMAGPVMVTTTTAAIENLTAETTYEVQVRANAGDASSDYSAPLSATTPAASGDDGDDNGGDTGGDNGGNTGGDTGSGQACDVPNMLTNGDFETSDTNGWDLYVNNNAAAVATGTVVAETGFDSINTLLVDINTSFVENDIQLKNTFGTLTQGETYILTFNAKATAEKTIKVKIHQTTSPWANVKEEDAITLTTSVQEYSVLYTPESDLGTLNLGFFLGADTTNVYIDDVSLKTYCADEPVEPVELAVPANVMAQAVDHSSATVSWDAVADATHYALQQKSGSDAWVDVSTNIEATSFTVAELMAETSYEFQVKAINAETESAFSAPASVTLPAAPADDSDDDTDGDTDDDTTDGGDDNTDDQGADEKDDEKPTFGCSVGSGSALDPTLLLMLLIAGANITRRRMKRNN